MFIIDKVAYSSKIISVYPYQKVLCAFIPLLLCLILSNISVGLFTLLSVSIATISFNPAAKRIYLRILLIPFLFLLLSTLLIITTRADGNEALVSFSMLSQNYGVTLDSITKGCTLIIRSLGCISCMYFISLNVPMIDIVRFFKSCGVPNIVIAIIEMSYRYVFILIDEVSRIKSAQKSRFGYINYKSAVRSMGLLIGTLFIRCLMKSDMVYNAMQSRGYSGVIPVLDKRFNFDIYLLLTFVSIVILQITIFFIGV